MTSYPFGFSDGVDIRGVPVITTQNPTGKVFWVDSNVGSDGNSGRPTYPLATVAKAVSLCTANKGDVIYVAPNHAETIADATSLVLSIAGISLLGQGNSSSRPTITFATAAAASIVVSAADVRISNMNFVCNIASQVTMIDCNAATTRIDNCYFTEGSATGLTFIDVNGGGANVCDGVKVINCEFNAPTAGNYNTAIELGEVADKVEVKGCTVFGDFDDACIHNPTGKVLTNLTLVDCVLSNNQTGIHAVELVSACTGIAKNLSMFTDTYATTIDPGALKCFGTYSVSAVDVNARLNPVIET